MLRLILDYPSQLYAYIGVPAQHQGAVVQTGTYDVDIYLDGYAHLVSIGWVKCPPPVLHTCPHYREYNYILVRWQVTSSVCELCFDCCLSIN